MAVCAFAALLVYNCYVFPRPITLALVLHLFVGAVIIGIALNAFIARKLIKSAFENLQSGGWQFRLGRFRNELNAGLVLHVATLFFWLTINIDKFVAARMLNLKDFGVYSVAASVAQPASLLAIITLKTLLVGDAAIHNKDLRGSQLRHMAAVIIVSTVVLSTILWLGLKFIVPILFGVEYSGVIAIAGWLLLGNVLTPIRNLLVEQARVRNKASMTAIIETVFLVVFCGSAYILAPYLSSSLFGISFLIANIASLASILTIRNR